MLYENSGLYAGCHSAGIRWQETDGTQISLIWFACDEQEIHLLSSTYAVARTHIPAASRGLSALGANIDLVRARAGGPVWRFWLQGTLSLALASVCPHQPVRACAHLTAPAARYLATRLPGQPVVTKVDSVFPPVSGLLGAFVFYWLLFVGRDRLARRLKLENFHMVPDSQRLLRVDYAADELRKVSRRRGWGNLVVVTAAVLLASGVAGMLTRPSGAGAGDTGAGVVLAGVGVIMLRRYRHPLLARERYHRRAISTEDRHPHRFLSFTRRLLSAGLILFLSVLSVLMPLTVLAGWVLAGLASAAQDLFPILAGLVLAAVTAGYFIDRAAQRLRARSFQEAMKRDPLRSMLYLRNFGDDAQKIATSRLSRRGIWQRSTGWLNPVGGARFEEILTRALARSGPVVAVGQPGGKLRALSSAIAPALGAARTTLAQDEWQDRVRQWAIESRAVVVSATPAQISPEGFAWELDMLARDVEHGRIILVFGTGTKAELHQRVGAFLSTVSRYPLFQDLASGWINDGTLILVHVPAEGWGTWRGWGAKRRTAWTYTAAIGAALAYAEEAWGTPPAKLIPPGKEPSTGREQEREQSASPVPPASRLTGFPPLTETVESALNAAADIADRHGQPIDTKTLLVSLMDADPAGRWDRICLYSRSREDIEQASDKDPPLPSCRWNNVVLTGACVRAFETAWRVSLQYQRTPLQLGVLILGLIADKSTAASRALNITGQGQQENMTQIIQEDLIGTTLIGLRLDSPSGTARRRSRSPRSVRHH